MLERHHVVFKSQGGLDFPLNYQYLSPEQHRGKFGPHMNREMDLHYKREMQKALEKVLTKNTYSIEELIILLELEPTQANKAFKKLLTYKGIGRGTVIRRLMGGRFY